MKAIAPFTGNVPNKPWVLNSGLKHGQCLDQLMFKPGGYEYIYHQLETMNKAMDADSLRNDFHLHLEWLVFMAEACQPNYLCPQCHRLPITRFTRIGSAGGYSLSLIYSACNNRLCKEKVENGCLDVNPSWLPFRFSTLEQFNVMSDQEVFIRMLRQAFELDKKKLTQKVAFEFFKQNYERHMIQIGILAMKLDELFTLVREKSCGYSLAISELSTLFTGCSTTLFFGMSVNSLKMGIPEIVHLVARSYSINLEALNRKILLIYLKVKEQIFLMPSNPTLQPED